MCKFKSVHTHVPCKITDLKLLNGYKEQKQEAATVCFKLFQRHKQTNTAVRALVPLIGTKI